MTAVFHQAFPDRKALGLNVPEAVLIVGGDRGHHVAAGKDFPGIRNAGLDEHPLKPVSAVVRIHNDRIKRGGGEELFAVPAKIPA